MQKHQQNLKRLVATLAITGCAAFASVYLMLSSANAPCHNTPDIFAASNGVSTHQLQKGNANVEALCNRNNQQISWVTWLFKRPTSAQFHFIDLLELLERNS